MHGRHEAAFGDSIFRETHLEAVVIGGSQRKSHFLAGLLLLAIALAGDFGGVALGGGVFGIPCT